MTVIGPLQIKNKDEMRMIVTVMWLLSRDDDATDLLTQYICIGIHIMTIAQGAAFPIMMAREV